MASDEEDTDTKLAILASLHPLVDASTIFETLIEADGSVETASQRLQPLGGAENDAPAAKRQKTTGDGGGGSNGDKSTTAAPPLPSVPGQQLSIRRFHSGPSPLGPAVRRPARKGQTLHLYSAEDVALHTPCSIVHNFLPAGEALSLLRELLAESESFGRISFKMFERVVASPHSAAFYVATGAEQDAQRREFAYNGAYLDDVRTLTPCLARVAGPVEDAVNEEVRTRVRDRYPGARKLRYQSAERWRPNCAFVNCYDGASESVGFHSDQLTYLGPRAVIGSLSLGVAREFRIKRVVPKDGPAEPDDAEVDGAADGNVQNGGNAHPTRSPPAKSSTTSPHLKRKSSDGPNGSHSSETPVSTDSSPGKSKPRPSGSAAAETGVTPAEDDASVGQIAIHLPHNSLLVMHAEMQEGWKHSIAAAGTVVPHAVAGRKRINVTYRWYRPEFHPRFTPRCRCGFPAVLRTAQRRAASRGRYMWMCHVNYSASAGTAGGGVGGGSNGGGGGSGGDGSNGGGGGGGCGFFQWAEFDDDGRPKWAWGDKSSEDASNEGSGGGDRNGNVKRRHEN